MARLPKAAESRVLLIGTSNYRADSGFLPLRNVLRNVVGLEETLCGNEVGGFLREHCETLLNPSAPDQVRVAIARAADEATDTLLIYYAGHAERDEKGELYLTTSESVSGPTNIAFSGLRYKTLEDCLRRAPAQNKIVILDCCHSGAANPMSGTALLTEPAAVTDEEAEIEGTCVLTSCRANQVSLDSDGHGFTAFTGHLLRVLRDGIPGGPDLLDLDAVHHQVVRSMKGLEQRPRKAGGDTVSGLALVRNAAHGGVPRAAQSSVPGVPAMPSFPAPPRHAVREAAAGEIPRAFGDRGRSRRCGAGVLAGTGDGSGGQGQGHGPAVGLGDGVTGATGLEGSRRVADIVIGSP